MVKCKLIKYAWEVLTIFIQTVPWGFDTELATGLAIIHIREVGKDMSLVKQFETDRFVWRSLLLDAS